MKLKCIIFAFSIIFPLSLFSQSSIIKGKIIDKNSKELLPFITVRLYKYKPKFNILNSSNYKKYIEAHYPKGNSVNSNGDTFKTTMSVIDGTYSIKTSPGTYLIQFTCLGWHDTIEKVIVKDEKPVYLDINLNPFALDDDFDVKVNDDHINKKELMNSETFKSDELHRMPK